jgi:hypothetical protein
MLLDGTLPSRDDNDHRDERRGVYDKCGSDAGGGDEQAGHGRSDDRRRVVFDAVQCSGSRQVFSRDQFGQYRPPTWGFHGLPGGQRKRQREKQPGSHRS